MKAMKMFTIAIVLLCTFKANALGQDLKSQRTTDMDSESPEAYTACEGNEAGDVVQFVSPYGEIVMGTCEQQGRRLILRPDPTEGPYLQLRSPGA